MQLCGDPTCESSGCDSASIERWEAEQDRLAREYVRGLIREAAAIHRLPLPEGF